ncbi:MAG: FGGY family carbohydrate kinase [Eubacteriales bacterium]|nr:FGGY family carbohydrate kinase [Eubacteriales bacterium]
MTREYVIAYDLGTSGVKVALVDLKGRFICDATQNYPLLTPHPGWAEQDPMDYWQGVCNVARNVLAQAARRPQDARGIAFGTQWKGIIPLDAAGKVLHNSIIWLDSRAEDQAKRLNNHFHKELFCSADYWPKLLWFKENHPHLYEQANIILEANSFLKWKATGVAGIDISNHFTRSFDDGLQEFYEEFLRFGNMDLAKFPQLVRSTDLVGTVTTEAAAEMGLVPGIPVFGGCGDIPAITIGSGSTKVGNMHAYFGSSGWFGITRAHSDKDLYISPFDEQRDIFLFVSQSIGLSLNWTIEQLYHEEMKKLGTGIYDYINEQIENIPPGSDGVLATPWLYGERPPNFSEAARCNFLNLNSCHDRRHMLKALMESVCYTLKVNIEDHWAQNNARPACVNAVGGGACSAVWMQALADILELPVNVPRNPRHAGAIGTAYCALIGLGYCSSYEDAAANIEIEHAFRPRPEAIPVYRKSYDVFKELYSILQPVFQKMQ